MKRKKTPIRVAVLCGGISGEHDVSLKSGGQVLKHLPAPYQGTQINITKTGEWLSRGKKIQPGKLNGFDVAFIALHGRGGEDGHVQALLDLSGIPYTGSGVLASALAMDKFRTQEMLKSVGIRSPRSVRVTPTMTMNEALKEVRKQINVPCVIKPNEGGSSLGVTIVEKQSHLKSAIDKARNEDANILIQERIIGRELTCGVIGNTGEELLALPPIEIIHEGAFFDYAAKYVSTKTQEICPAPLSKALTAHVKEAAQRVHATIGCDGLTRSDFILTPSKTLYFLEINTIPGLTEQSLCPKEAQAIGMPFPVFLDMQLRLAIDKFAFPCYTKA